MRFHRTDFAGPIEKPQRTPQGGLSVPANLTRAGVLRYRDTDGREWGELRHPDEVRGDGPSESRYLRRARSRTRSPLNSRGACPLEAAQNPRNGASDFPKYVPAAPPPRPQAWSQETASEKIGIHPKHPQRIELGTTTY